MSPCQWSVSIRHKFIRSQVCFDSFGSESYKNDFFRWRSRQFSTYGSIDPSRPNWVCYTAAIKRMRSQKYFSFKTATNPRVNITEKWPTFTRSGISSSKGFDRTLTLLYVFVSILESISQTSDLTVDERSDLSPNESSTAKGHERFSRAHFFLKDIKTTMSYLEAFSAIAAIYPFVQSNRNDIVPKIRYLCVAGNIPIDLNRISRLQLLDTSKSSTDHFISIHLSFERTVNFKRKFLNHLFAGKDWI